MEGQQGFDALPPMEPGLQGLIKAITDLNESVGSAIHSADPTHLMKLEQISKQAKVALAEALGEINNEDEGRASDSDAQQLNVQNNQKPISEDEFKKMTAKEREAALKRAKNREAARRSRQRKNERINSLQKDVKTLASQNAMLIKCIEQLAEKSYQCKVEQSSLVEVQLPQQLNPVLQQQQQQQPQVIDGAPHQPMEQEEAKMAIDIVETQPKPRTNGSPSRIANPLLSLPPLEDLPRSVQTIAGQLTARDTLSARAALAEHMAMLSRDNSPRDEEEAAAGGGGAGPTTTGAVATTTTTGVNNNPADKATLQVPTNGANFINIDELMVPVENLTHDKVDR